MGAINVQRVILGLPESGKTSLARELIAEDVRRGWVALAHDPFRDLSTVCAAYDSVDHFLTEYEHVRAAGGRMPSSLAIGGATPDPVIDLAMSLAAVLPSPLSLLLDEAALLAESGPTHIGKRDLALITGRRHFGDDRGIAVTLLAQDPGVLTAQWLRFATEIYSFRMTDAGRIRKVADIAGVQGLDEVLPHLPERYRCVRFRPGDDVRQAATR